jgi:hypothetical protein
MLQSAQQTGISVSHMFVALAQCDSDGPERGVAGKRCSVSAFCTNPL